jgi:predicted acylesterase/phospholipase RssA
MTPDESILTDEVRLAMAWNGGVSLAVWMGGAAVEFDCARRSYLGPELKSELVGHNRVVYNALYEAFSRRLRIDIIAGASAGGLNGALLAGTINSGRRLNPEFLRKQWLDLGDFSDLLQPTSESKPSSLMRGDLFRTRLITALKALLGQTDADLPDRDLEEATRPDPNDMDRSKPLDSQVAANGGEPPRDDVVLEVQVTDVTGEPQGFTDDWGQVLYAREYRTPVRFLSPGDYTVLTLATAARASSSFPAAFEPQKIDGPTAKLAGLGNEERYAIDGGLLENAPIKAALDLIPMRQAADAGTFVRRVLCYVNAAPSAEAFDPRTTDQPTLRSVLGYVVNLPRVAREVDQLTAIKRAVQGSKTAGDAIDSLLRMERGVLIDVATNLLPTYRASRAVLSLEELLGDEADAVFDRIWTTPDLPWIPRSIDVRDEVGMWQWGFRAGQRVLLLELDLIGRGLKPRAGEAMPELSPDQLRTVQDARSTIYAQFDALEAARREFLENDGIVGDTKALATSTTPAAGLRALGATMDAQGFGERVLGAVLAGTTAFENALAVIETRPDPDPLLTRATLFADEGDGDYFLRTALAVEVVRRVFAPEQDLESSQPLTFAQLTPFVPCKVMTAEPFQKSGPAGSDDKLLGVLFSHFGGFYRRSWRANDFMWGRLDGATRIIDLIVGVKRGKDLANEPGAQARWAALAEALVPAGDKPADQDLLRLAEEALADAAQSAVIEEPVSVGHEGPKLVLPAELVAELNAKDYCGDRLRVVHCLAKVIDADFGEFGTGVFTRVVCARAAQYEVLREELPRLVEETQNDVAAGAYTAALDWATKDSLWETLGALRDYRRKGRSLPALLGRFSSEESASTLAMRTLSHAALVTIAALPAATVPLAGVFSFARPPFLSIFGISAKGWWPRVAVIGVFAATTIYVTGRVVTAAPQRAPGSGYQVPVGSIWSLPVLVMFLAALTAFGVVAVPAWRGVRSSGWRKAVHLGAAVALAALWGVVAIWLCARQFGFAAAITGQGGFKPPTWALWTVLSIAVGAPLIIRHLPIPGPVQGWAESFANRLITRESTTSVGALVSAAILMVYSVRPLFRHLCGCDWRTAAASCAIAAMVVCAAYVLTVPLWRGTRIRRARKHPQ